MSQLLIILNTQIHIHITHIKELDYFLTYYNMLYIIGIGFLNLL